MKALVRDSFDASLCCYDVVSAFVTDSVYVETSANDYDFYEFPAVLQLNTMTDVEIYIVAEDVTAAEALVRRFFTTDCVDLTYYSDVTFINPDYRDVETIKSLLKEVSVVD